jgi:hypothetical protein
MLKILIKGKYPGTPQAHVVPLWESLELIGFPLIHVSLAKPVFLVLFEKRTTTCGL